MGIYGSIRGQPRGISSPLVRNKQKKYESIREILQGGNQFLCVSLSGKAHGILAFSQQKRARIYFLSKQVFVKEKVLMRAIVFGQNAFLSKHQIPALKNK